MSSDDTMIRRLEIAKGLMAERTKMKYQSLSTDLDRRPQGVQPIVEGIDVPWSLSDELKRRLRQTPPEAGMFIKKEFRNQPKPEVVSYEPEIIRDKSVRAIMGEKGPAKDVVIRDLANFFADLRAKVSWKGSSYVNTNLAAELVYKKIEKGWKDWPILRASTVNFEKIAVRLFSELLNELAE